MHTIKKLYCRTFQAGFRLAMPFMPYREPGILNSVSEVEPLLQKLGVKSVLLVTDKMLRQFGATAKLEKVLADGNIKCTVYDETCPNPTVNNVEAARELYVKENCNAEKRIVASNCNGSFGYIPTENMFYDTIYESRPGSSNFDPDAGYKMADKLLEMGK